MGFRRVLSLLLLCFLSCAVAFTAFAQEEDQEEEGGDSDEFPIESEWTGPLPDRYAPGDRMFTVAVGALFPIVFLDESGSAYDSQIKPGLSLGAIGLNFFLTSGFFVGGEFSLGFSWTINEILFQLPFGARLGYQFTLNSPRLPSLLNRFEFPVSIMVGLYSQSYLSKNYFGLFLKPEVAAYFRFNSDWSFGVNVGWWWVPQWPESGSQHNRYGNFLNTTLSARYLF
jgi:hypothetical protein